MSDMIVRLIDFDSVENFEHWAYQEILRYRMKSDELEQQLAEANAKVAEWQQVINMLTLCGEPECCETKGYPQKLRALIDGVIGLRAKVAELESERADEAKWARHYAAKFHTSELKLADLTARLEAHSVPVDEKWKAFWDGQHGDPYEIGEMQLSRLSYQAGHDAGMKQARLEAQEASETVAENGKWSIGKDDDRRYFVESDDFTHDVRLYLVGDFESGEQRYHYLGEIISRLNRPQPTPPVQAAVAEAYRKAAEVCGKYAGAEGSAMRVQMERELARIPHDDSALREICLKVAVDTLNDVGWIPDHVNAEAIVARVLGEVK